MALKPCKECGREISTEAKACPHCGKANPTGVRTSPIAMGCLIIILLGIIGSIFSSGDSGSGTSPARTPTPKEQAIAALKLDFAWRKGGLDNVMLADFTISNPTGFQMKDIEITCVHFAKSGTRIDSNTRTIYEVILPHGKLRKREFNMGFIHSQARSSNCSISDLVVQ